MKHDQLYTITFIAPYAMTHVILAACEGREVSLVSVLPIKEDSIAPPPAQARTLHYINGKKDKGISSEALVLECINSEPKRSWTGNELGEIFVKRSFARTSWASATSNLVKAGKIRRVKLGVFAPLGLTVRMGAA